MKCEGRDLDSEQISKFRPTSQMRLAQAVTVFQDKLLKRMTGGWSAVYWRGMRISACGAGDSLPSPAIHKTAALQQMGEKLDFLGLWFVGAGNLIKLIGDTLSVSQVQFHKPMDELFLKNQTPLQKAGSSFTSFWSREESLPSKEIFLPQWWWSCWVSLPLWEGQSYPKLLRWRARWSSPNQSCGPGAVAFYILLGMGKHGNLPACWSMPYTCQDVKTL